MILRGRNYIKIIFAVIAIIPFLCSCSKPKQNIRTIFEGKWVDVSYATLLGGIRYDFRFVSDSFYLKKHEYTDVYSPCLPIQANQFYSGLFKYDKDSIYLKGIRTDSINNEVDKTECIKNLVFNASYKYEFHSDTLVFFPREYKRFGSDEFMREHMEFFAIYLKNGVENYPGDIPPPREDQKQK